MFAFTDQDPDFWIQLKGNDAGKPLRVPISNSIGVKANPAHLVPDFLFYTVQFLHLSGAFTPYIKGSAVPFITQRSIVQVLLNHFVLQAITT